MPDTAKSIIKVGEGSSVLE